MKVCFAYVTDKKGFELAGLSAISVALSQPRPCHIHVFCHNFLPEGTSRWSEEVVKLGAKLTFSQIGDAAVEQYRTHGHVTTPTLLKLTAVAALVPDFDRVVYLDNDVLVFEDLKIGDLDFGSYPIGAVTDMDLSATGVLRNSGWGSASAGVRGTGDYFNAGVMIFASANWRDAFLATYAAALERHDHGCVYKLDCTSIDQCAVNTTFADNWLKLPATYNMQAGSKFTSSWQTAAVRHYCGPRKCVPLQAFRSDGRDVRTTNAIRGRLGFPKSRLGFVYEFLFSLNRIRNYRGGLAMRKFLSAHAAEVAKPPVPSKSREHRVRVPQQA
jgi:lipopolysaccharide biosynthesis glycosyltransferase